MRAQATKLAAVMAMVIGLALGTVGATTAATSIPCIEALEIGGAGDARTTSVRVSADGDGTPRVGYMVARSFVGFLPE